MRILIATDGSEYSKAAVEKACELIRPHGDEVNCISTFEDPLPMAYDPSFLSAEHYQKMLDAVRGCAISYADDAKRQIEEHFSTGAVPVETYVTDGPAEQMIVEKAEEWHADLIVVGSHGRGFWGRLLGSVSNGVVHHAPCSVLVVKRPV